MDFNKLLVNCLIATALFFKNFQYSKLELKISSPTLFSLILISSYNKSIEISDLQFKISLNPMESRFSKWFEHRGLISNIEIIFIRLSVAHIYFRFCGFESLSMRFFLLINLES